MEEKGARLPNEKDLTISQADFNDRLRHLRDAVDSKKGLDIVVLDLRGLSSDLDAFLICHGTSARHVRAIAEAVDEKLNEFGENPLFIEGLNEASWVLIDCGDVGVHVFEEKTRDYYRLEELWSHAPLMQEVGSASGRPSD